MLLSIIVPVYNVEKYLCRCVDSLLDQGDFKDYEIILVDDGSTDNSVNICDSYAENFDLVKVIHKVNGGLSSARNAGIKSAAGEYVMFVDSDDYIKSFALSKLTNVIIKGKLDILVYNFSHIYEQHDAVDNDAFLKDYNEIVTGSKYMKDNLKSGTMHMMACNKIYKKSLIVTHNVFFREGYVHEDEEWSPRLIIHASRVQQINLVVYGYCIRKDSISSYQNKRKAALDLVSNCEQLSISSNTIKDLELKHQIENNIATLCFSAFYKGRLIDNTERVIKLIGNINIKDNNLRKYNLLKFSSRLYLITNDCAKRLNLLRVILTKLPNKMIAIKNILLNKLRKQCRAIFVTKKQRQNLQNHSFSIIASSCNGGVITSELGEQFRTPTINLWFEANDYIKFIKNLRYYISLSPTQVTNNFYNYPVGRIDDITIYFMHYHTFEEAVNKWDERKKRINYNNLFFMMAEKDGCTPDMVREFDSLPYKNKVIFTYNEYPDCHSAICVKKCSLNGEVAIMTDFVGLTGRKYDKYFDYVKWLNEGEHE